MSNVDYRAWNSIQESRHGAEPKFRIPNWFYTAAVILLLVATALLVGKVVMYKPSEYITIQPVEVNIEPLKITVDVNTSSTGTSKIKVDGGSGLVETKTDGVPERSSKKGYSCPPIKFPSVPKGTSCRATRQNGEITLTCGDKSVSGIPTLQCLFDKLPKDTYEIE